MTEETRTGRPPSGPSPDVGERSFGELVGELTNDLSRLVRQELELAKAETKEDLAKAGRGAGLLSGAGMAALLMLVFLSLALMFALDDAMGVGWAALIVGALWAVVTAVLAVLGRSQLRRATPPLTQTTESLKEDARWAQRQTS